MAKKRPISYGMMNRTLPLLATLVILFTVGCANKNQSKTTDDVQGKPADEAVEETPQGIGWYYFSDKGIHPAQNPAEIPAKEFRPWTEAVRVSDAAIVNGVPSLLINRLGLMSSGIGDGTPALHTDGIFSTGTAAGIYKTDETTGIRFYRNSFFSDKATETTDGNGICLASFDAGTGKFEIYLTAEDLGLDREAQCVALDRIGSMWYSSFKLEKNGKVDFTYLEFESFPKKNESGTYDISGLRKITSEAYQNSVSPFGWKDAPEPLKSILSGLPEEMPFNLKVYSADTDDTQSYVHSGTGTPVDGTAYISDTVTAVLFADGTFYYKADDTSEKPQISKLPKLSSGYVYTNFVISGTSLLSAWEEQRFFETGRAGLLVTTLPDAVY
jgi:hypothetical protein